MNVATKIKSVQRNVVAEVNDAHFNLGMVDGLKRTIRPDFDYDLELLKASDAIRQLLQQKNDETPEMDKAVGYYSGIVYSLVEDIFEAQASGYQELHLIKRQM